MKICDRSTARDGIIKRANHQLHFADTDESFDLCNEEYALVRDFILNPNDWKHVSQIQNETPAPVKRPRGRPRKHPIGLPTNP